VVSKVVILSMKFIKKKYYINKNWINILYDKKLNEVFILRFFITYATLEIRNWDWYFIDSAFNESIVSFYCNLFNMNSSKNVKFTN